MPHVRCLGCGVVSYTPAGGEGTCPECGVPWPRRPDEVIRSADPERRLDALLRMTRDLLDTEVALLTHIADGRETACLAAGEWPEIGQLQGASLPLEDTFCRLMLEGVIPNVIPDTQADERVASLAMTRRFGVGAYMGLPLRPSDAELYVLCCLAREARPSLGARELRMLSGLAESVQAELQSR
jgi:GAF domain-containing protein